MISLSRHLYNWASYWSTFYIIGLLLKLGLSLAGIDEFRPIIGLSFTYLRLVLGRYLKLRNIIGQRFKQVSLAVGHYISAWYWVPIKLFGPLFGPSWISVPTMRDHIYSSPWIGDRLYFMDSIRPSFHILAFTRRAFYIAALYKMKGVNCFGRKFILTISRTLSTIISISILVTFWLLLLY